MILAGNTVGGGRPPLETSSYMVGYGGGEEILRNSHSRVHLTVATFS